MLIAILRLPDVLARTALSKPTLYRLMNAGDFPRSVSLGGRAVGWRDNEITEWIESRPRTGATTEGGAT